jgi:uncharacterized protein YndB with AHSA1/START domain
MSEAREAKTSGDQDRVVAEIEIAAPPERVFQALTDAKQLFTWWGAEPTVDLLQFDMDSQPGGKYRYTCTPRASSKYGEVHEELKRKGEPAFVCHGEILESAPPRLLVWSWLANWHEDPERPTTVRWELTPTKTGTHVRVTHSRLAEEPISRKDYGQGWQGVLRLLQTYLQR